MLEKRFSNNSPAGKAVLNTTCMSVPNLEIIKYNICIYIYSLLENEMTVPVKEMHHSLYKILRWTCFKVNKLFLDCQMAPLSPMTDM